MTGRDMDDVNRDLIFGRGVRGSRGEEKELIVDKKDRSLKSVNEKHKVCPSYHQKKRLSVYHPRRRL